MLDNPFSDPSIPSLEWVRDEICGRYDLSHQHRMDMVSACNAAGRWFDLPLSAIPARASFLRPKFERLHPARVSVSQRRIDNVKSLILRAFREVRIATNLQPYGCALTPEWQDLYDRIEDRYIKTCLCRFFRFCSRQGIRPEDVDDDVMARYSDALEDETLVKDPRRSHQNACRCWNKSAQSIESWPRIEVTVPRYDTRTYVLPGDHFHSELVADIENYLATLAGTKIFEGPKKAFRPASIRSVRGHLLRYLSALHYSGLDIAEVRLLAEVVPFDIFRQGMEWFVERNGGKSSQSIGDTAWTIRVLAVKHCGVDEETAGNYDFAVSRLRVHRNGLSSKNREALRQFDDSSAVCSFLNCPDRLWERARKASGNDARLLAESAVAIELLIFAPVRFNNLRNISRDKHFSWIGDRLHLHFEEDEVKNSQALDFILPRFVGERIAKFFGAYHGQYLDGPNLHLFAGRNGRAKDESRLRRQIRGALFDETGIHLTPHQFRHVAVKLLLDQLPGHYEVARKILGHKKLSTVYDSYSGTETQAAVDLYDSVVLQLKHGESEPPEDRGRRRRKRSKKRSIPNARPRSPFMDPLNLFGKRTSGS